MGNSPGRFGVRRFSSVLALVVVLTALAALIAAPSGSARAKPKCFGQTATIVGANGADHIQGTAHKDVIVALGGNDTIETKDVKKNHGNDIVCGGPGNDTIQGDPDSENLIGGPGNDTIAAGNGNDLVVGDNANPNGDESGLVGRDDLAGSGGADFMVGDNYASGNAIGGADDINFRAGGGPDTVIGDSASVGNDNAIGGGDDRMGGADGNDLVIGDSYTVGGHAIGGGNDDNNSGPGADLAVGDSYTVNGTATGAGNDTLHAADGGDFDTRCKPVSSCDDVFYGDNYAKSCGLKWITCDKVSGGGFDLLNTDQGADFMNGGPLSTDGGGKLRDRCSGGPDAPDVSYQCEYNYPDVEQPH